MAVAVRQQGLMSALRQVVRGEVRGTQVDRMLYSTDASSYQVVPSCVVTPMDADDVAAVVRVTHAQGGSVVPRGGGTSLSGQAIGEGVVLDLTPHMNQILELNVAGKWAWGQGGMALARVNAQLAEHGLKVGPDPASAAAATIGGMTGNNSTGSHSILYGMMADNVKAVDVVLADGSQVRFEPKTPEQVAAIAAEDTLEAKIYREIPQLVHEYAEDIKERYPKTWRNVAGYNLNRIAANLYSGASLNLAPLIVGSEGTLGVITAVKLGLAEVPKATYLAVVHYESLKQALDSVPLILEHKPAAAELIDKFFNDLTRKSTEFGSRLTFIKGDPATVLVVEFYGDDGAVLAERAAALEAAVRDAGYAYDVVHCATPAEIANVWDVRKAGLGLLLSQRGDAKPLAFVDDASVPIENLSAFAGDVEAMLAEKGIQASFFAHASAGCLHINPMVNPKTVEGLATMRDISRAVMALAMKYDGTTTGEHGEGFARSIYNEELYGERLHQAFRQVKGIFDEQNTMNPGKIIDAPAPWDSSVMRLSPEYVTPHAPKTTFFDFSADGGFTGMVEMCNGQGACRKTDVGVMCPSYMATRDEAHSTRGRANALRAAISGGLGAAGLLSDELDEVMDLCLGCKACKRECPSMVDMAKLKYEYLAQRQAETGVSLSSWVFGNIALVNRIGALPGLRSLTNWSFKNTVTRRVIRWALGIDIRRELPAIAPQTFREWFNERETQQQQSRGQIVLWDDTFLTYNEPEIGRAAVKVLESIGYEVLLIKDRRCCGRPLISKGLLPQAIRQAEHNVKRLYRYVQAGIPLIGVEPSCIATLQDEYPDLLRSEAARMVAQNSHFIETFLAGEAANGAFEEINWNAPDERQTVHVHGHCHQRALIGTGDMVAMLNLLPNTDVRLIDSGCCGMAGSFGYEAKHYEVSMACGEDRLFPAVREAAADAVIAAPGTSCRHQIMDGTGRAVDHPIVLLANAIRD